MTDAHEETGVFTYVNEELIQSFAPPAVEKRKVFSGTSKMADQLTDTLANRGTGALYILGRRLSGVLNTVDLSSVCEEITRIYTQRLTDDDTTSLQLLLSSSYGKQKTAATFKSCSKAHFSVFERLLLSFLGRFQYQIINEFDS